MGQPAQGRGPGARCWTDLYSIQKKRKLGKLQKKEAWGGPAGYSELRGGQANSARLSAAPGAAAAGVRCNKQLATQTPGPCCAGASRGATRCLSGFVVHTRDFTRPFPLDYSSLLMSSQGGWAAAPRCTRNARFGVPQGHRRTLMGHIWSRPKLRCMLCRRSNSGLGAFSGVSSEQPLSSTNNSSVGEGLSLPGERFRGIGDCRAAKPKQKTRLQLAREGCWVLVEGY